MTGGPGVLERVRDYVGIAAGTAITALGLNLFLIPNRLNDGGLTGIAVVLHFLFRWPVGVTLLGLNLPLLASGAYFVGMRFGLKTIFGMVALSAFLELIPLHPVTHDVLLGAVYGGVLSGLGLGVTFRFGGSTGGTDIVARLIRYFFHFSLGEGLLGADFVVISLTGAVLGARLAMYSLFALFIGSRMVDLVQEGMDYQKAAWIIARDPETLADRIAREVGRGVTSLAGTGMYTRLPRPVLLVVVGRAEVPRLKRLVYDHDPRAFMVITTAHEVLGEGFKAPDAAAE